MQTLPGRDRRLAQLGVRWVLLRLLWSALRLYERGSRQEACELVHERGRRPGRLVTALAGPLSCLEAASCTVLVEGCVGFRSHRHSRWLARCSARTDDSHSRAA